jgi:hypothetical protein
MSAPRSKHRHFPLPAVPILSTFNFGGGVKVVNPTFGPIVRTAFLALSLFILEGCQPNDLPTRNTRQKLEAGELVEFKTPGYRRPSCQNRQPDWRELRVTTDERVRVVLGKQQSQLMPGKHSCLRVGGVVDLQILNASGSTSGRVQITKLALIKVGQLKASHLKGRYFASAQDFQSYLTDVRSRLKPEDQDIVMITEFTYLTGSAVDELILKQKDLEPKNMTTIVDFERESTP